MKNSRILTEAGRREWNWAQPGALGRNGLLAEDNAVCVDGSSEATLAAAPAASPLFQPGHRPFLTAGAFSFMVTCADFFLFQFLKSLQRPFAVLGVGFVVGAGAYV